LDTNKQLLFFFSLLGAFNGIILAVYFMFFSKKKKVYNIFLGLLLLVISIRIGKSVFFYFNKDLSNIYIHVGIMACVLIGPLLYLFIRSALVNERVLKKYDALHTIPLFVVIAIAIQFPYWEYRSLWSNLINLIYWQWFVYIIISAFNLIPVFKNVNREFKTQNNISNVWLLSVFIGVSIIWLAYKTSRYTSYIVGAVSFSFVFYISGLLIFKISKKQKEVIKTKRSTKQFIDNDVIKTIESKLEELLNDNKIYKNSNLKMPDLATKLNVSSHVLSQYLNEILEKNFAQFINEYRVKEAELLLKSSKNYTIEAIAYDSGFNSVSAFYTAFKNINKITPAAFKKKQLA